MADIKKSMDILKYLEYSNRTELMLEQNKNEDGLTYCGIYQSAHPNWKGWTIIKRYLDNEPNLKKCSLILANVSDLQQWVNQFYKENFWDIAKLDEVNSQKIADEIFIFGVNVGMKVAIRKAQKLVGVDSDGNVGSMTLKAFNTFDVITFDGQFDDLEKEYYDAVIVAKPYLSGNHNGWDYRADYV